ncbi:hypothetical protein CTAYLR_000479 [Chrysophaeum taylorii]|uniref:EamA domain-containing protein n=1 Tax=Chrysophaeum taylorii TaxID=2483200 RepID=A0AAD7UI03_9STRA|nr:hypothetical protein CTAYLR_000479 [Chrysophaeum taylorii]
MQLWEALLPRSDQGKGVGIALLGTIAATPDAVLLRWCKELGADDTAILFWKCIFAFAFGVVAAPASERRDETSVAEALTLAPGHVVGLVLSRAAINITISLAFLLTYAVNVLLCYSLNPLISGVLGWVCLGDALPPRTLVAVACATVSIAVITLHGRHQGSQSNRLGDALAVAASAFVSINFVLTRSASRSYRAPVGLASAGGVLVAAIIVAVAAPPLGFSVVGGVAPLFFVAAGLCGSCVGVLIVAFAIAPRWITAAETGLISLIQVPLGPVWVYAAYREKPPVPTIVGGCALFAVVLAHEWVSYEASLKKKKKKKTTVGVPKLAPATGGVQAGFLSTPPAPTSADSC